MKYQILLILFILLYSSFVSAEKKCIFNEYLNITGDFVEEDCENKNIIGKELFDVNIAPRDSRISIVYRPLKDNAPLDLEIIRGNPPTTRLKQPFYDPRYNFQLNVPNQESIMFVVSIIGSNEWDLNYGNKILPTTPKPGTESTLKPETESTPKPGTESTPKPEPIGFWKILARIAIIITIFTAIILLIVNRNKFVPVIKKKLKKHYKKF